MTKKELKLIKPMLSPGQYRVVELMQIHSRNWLSYKEINSVTGQTCCWKRLCEIDKLYEKLINRNDIMTPEEKVLGKAYFRRSRWREDANRFGEPVRYKQFQLGR